MITDDDIPFDFSLVTKVDQHFNDGIRSRVDNTGFILERFRPDNTWEPFLLGMSGVHVATVFLTDAQLKTLNTQRLQIVPAPGAGLILFPFAVMLQCQFVQAYDTWPVDTVFYVGNQLFLDITSFAQTTDFTQYFSSITVFSGSSGTFSNKPITMAADDLDPPTGGNPANILKVTVVYFVS